MALLQQLTHNFWRKTLILSQETSATVPQRLHARGSHLAKKRKPNLNPRHSLFFTICTKMLYLSRNSLRNRASLDQCKSKKPKRKTKEISVRLRSYYCASFYFPRVCKLNKIIVVLISISTSHGR